MTARPRVVPEWATDAISGGIVEPVELRRRGGFVVGEQPPAPWMNWQFYQIGNSLKFLLGPSTTNWSFHDSPQLREISADTDTPEALSAPIFRLLAVAAGQTKLYASQRGQSWKQLSPSGAGGFGTPARVLWTGLRWLVGTSTGKSWATVGDGVAGSGVTSDSNAWTACTMPAGSGGITAIAVAPTAPSTSESGNIVIGRGAQLLYSLDDGATFSVVAGSLSIGSAISCVLFDGIAWIAISTTGEIFRSTTASGSWTELGAAIDAGTWSVASDGTTIAAVPADVSGTRWFVSVDHGLTWTAQASPTNIGSYGRIRFIDGAWFITSGQAPYLSTSNTIDDLSWIRLKLPAVNGDAPGLNDLILSEGSMIAIGEGGVFVGDRAADLSPGPWAPPTSPVQLHDAAYLRGHLITGDDPADGDTLIWNATDGEFEFGAGGGGGGGGTASDIAVGGDTWGDVYFHGTAALERLAAGTAGFVLQTNGPGVDPSWVDVIHADGSRPWTNDQDLGGFKFTGVGTVEGNTTLTLDTKGSNDLIFKVNHVEAGRFHQADKSLMLNTSRVGGAAGALILGGAGYGLFFDDGAAKINLISGTGPINYGDTGYAIILQGNSITATASNAANVSGSRVVLQIGGFEGARLSADRTWCVGNSTGGNAGGVLIANDTGYQELDSGGTAHSLMKLSALGVFTIGESSLVPSILGGLSIPSGKAITGAGSLTIDASGTLTYGASATAMAFGSGSVFGTFNGGLKVDTGKTYSVKTGTLLLDAPSGQNVDLTVAGTPVFRAAPTYTQQLVGVSIRRTTVADTNYTALVTDHRIAYTSLTTTRVVTGPSSPAPEQEYIFVDESGNASAVIKINFTPASGTIDGVSSKTMVNSAFGSYRAYFDGTNWHSSAS